MRIGELARLTGLNVSNIRFYERKGLLCPNREDGSKYRDYTEADVLRLKEILLYRKMGISIETIYLLINGQAFFLPGSLNHFCTGCYSCIKDETKCPYFNACLLSGVFRSAEGFY